MSEDLFVKMCYLVSLRESPASLKVTIQLRVISLRACLVQSASLAYDDAADIQDLGDGWNGYRREDKVDSSIPDTNEEGRFWFKHGVPELGAALFQADFRW